MRKRSVGSRPWKSNCCPGENAAEVMAHSRLPAKTLRGHIPQGGSLPDMRPLQVRKVIVFGGSAGSIPALCRILQGLPANLSAGLLAVIHTSGKNSLLPEVLGRCGPI